MVRKPELPELVPRPLSQAAYNPPYPTTPPDEHPPPLVHDPQSSDTNGYQFVSHEDAGDSDISSSSDWDEPEDEDDAKKDQFPASLRPGGHRPTSSQKLNPGELPALLRVGPPGGSPAPRISIDSEDDRPKSPEKAEEKKPASQPSTTPAPAVGTPPPQPVSPPLPVVSPPPPASAGPESPVPGTLERRPTIPLQSQNPYRRIPPQTTGDSGYGDDDRKATWDAQKSINQEPIEMPLDNNTPVDQFSKLSMWDNVESASQTPPPKPPPAAPGNSTVPDSPAPTDSAYPTGDGLRHASDASSAFYPGMDLSSLDAATSRNHGLPSDADAQEQRTWQEQQAWERSERERREREAAEALERATQEEKERQAEEEWHRGEAAAKAAAQEQAPPKPQGAMPPKLPPRPSTASTTASTTAEHAPAMPLRHHNIDGAGSAAAPDVETPGTMQLRQRKENYSIKHIRWFDSHTDNVREAPVLTQNANGPCPLLALVNALILSTPARQQSTLMETLKTRETISLGLLLDAVFDELMSGQRGSAAPELPDVGDLYAFLLALHTGMNVNPQFVATDSESLSSTKPGGFEQTREMKLYSTFNIPLIHGWMPSSKSIAYAAFNRSAKTYEDAQNIQFHEEELEVKLSSSGLSPQEQDLYEDLQAIKEFLQRWPTQLTDHGLKVMKDCLKPGQFAILFRNDHFSTIYKEPRSQKILTLVTDTGYSSHEEIVWESLVDVTGRGSELFSGDFRPVSHSTGATQERPIRSLLDDDTPNRQGAGFPNGGGITYPQESGTVGGAASTEQEDADLALALQLQEEEDDRHRREADARRRRENELSHNFLSNEATSHSGPTTNPAAGTTPSRITDTIRGQDIRPLIPPRRNNVQTHRPAAADGEEPPPPTYEQAASSPVYVPGQGASGQGLPSLPQGGAGRGSVNSQHGRGQSAYASTSQSYWLGGRGNGRGRRTSQPLPPANAAAGPSSMPQGGRRYSGQQQAAGAKDEKCVVM